MNLRSYQTFYDYIFGNLADIEGSVKDAPDEEHKKKSSAVKAQKMYDFFHDEKKPFIDISCGQEFRHALRHLKAAHLERTLYGNDNEPLSRFVYFSIPDDKDINARFQQFQNYYGLITEDKEQAFQQFIAYFKVAKLVADVVEMNNSQEDGTAYMHAYKMLVLFGGQSKPNKYFKALDTFLINNNFQSKPKPLHDALIWGLPRNIPGKPSIHLAEWRKIIVNSGPRACSLFASAKEIEEKLENKPPANFSQALEIAKAIQYKNATPESAELADLCMSYNLSTEIFDRCLEVLKTIKTRDFLPQISVDGKDVDQPGYHFVKLPIKDPRAFVLGHITDCCQSIGGHSENCVVDGVTRENNGFYVLLREKRKSGAQDKKKELKAGEKLNPFIKSSDGTLKIDYSHFEIVGQGYAWLSLRDNLVFDSWENLRPAKDGRGNDDAVIVPMLQRFAQLVTEQKDSTILRVTIGEGGKTPSFFSESTSENRVVSQEIIKEGEQYGDSSSQSLIYCNTKLRDELYQEIQRELKAIPVLDAEIKLENFITKDDVVSKTEVSGLILLIKNKNFQKCFQDKSIYQLLKTIKTEDKPTLFAILIKLSQFDLLSRDCVRKILTKNPKHQELMIQIANENVLTALTVLTDSEMLTPYFNLIVESNRDPFDWARIAKGLCLLKKERLLTDEIVKLVMQTELHDYGWEAVKDGIDLLRAKSLLNEENIRIVITIPESPLLTARALVALSENCDFDYLPELQKTIRHHNISLFKLFVTHKVKALNDPAFIYGNEYFSLGALSYAATFGDIEFMTLLLNMGFSVNVKNSGGGGDTPLQAVAASHKDIAIATVKFLIDSKADVNSRHESLLSPLKLFLKRKKYNEAALLLECKDLVIDKTVLLSNDFYDKSEPICEAILALNEAKILNRENFFFLIDDKSERYLSASRIGLVNALYDAQKFSVAMFEMVKKTNVDGKCPLETLLDLIGRNQLPNVSFEYFNKNNVNDYLFAIQLLHKSHLLLPEVIKHVLQTKSDKAVAMAKAIVSMFTENQKKYTEYFLTACGSDSNLELVKFILSFRLVKLIELNRHDTTPLQLAIQYKQHDIILFLLENPDVIVNIRNNRGYSPLHSAVAAGDVEIIKILLAHGADQNIQNKEGLTPIEMTKDPQIKQILSVKSSELIESKELAPKKS